MTIMGRNPEGENKISTGDRIKRFVRAGAKIGVAPLLLFSLTGIAYAVASHRGDPIYAVSTVTEFPDHFPGTITVGPADSGNLKDLHNPVSRDRGPARFALNGGNGTLVAFVPKGLEQQLNKDLAAGQEIDLTGQVVNNKGIIEGFNVVSFTPDS